MPLITASIHKNTPIQTKLDVQKPKAPLTFQVGQKPPRKRASSMAWPKEFEDIKAPALRLVLNDGQTPVIAVNADDHEEELEMREEEAGAVFFAHRQDDEGNPVAVKVEDVLFLTDNGDQYTADGVMPLTDYDYVQITGTNDELNKLQNAMQRFSKATGKGLIMRHESEERDTATGRIIRATKNVIRIR